MHVWVRRCGMALLAVAVSCWVIDSLPAQGQSIAPSPDAAPAELPAVPQGVEVLARGPVHEAFATPTGEPAPTKAVPKQPPKPIEEVPPDEKPEGDMIWVSGYWAWDDDKADFLWVSGIWRSLPPHKRWVPGYWRDQGQEWQWVPGFWSEAARAESSQDVSYYPAPPAPPVIASPGPPPLDDAFYVPGSWVWAGDKYVWRAGYWARMQPGYVWVAAHYTWTPNGYVFVPGYWDYAVAKRGVLFAPVYVNATVVGPAFVYKPAYVVSDTIVLDALFVRPSYGHYYFGDYYGPSYRTLGFETCVVYSRRNYDPIFVYSTWEHRAEPSWVSVQLDISLARHSGQAPLPPRTLVQQNLVVQRNVTNVTNVNNVTNITNNTTNVNSTTRNVTNNQVLMPASQMSAAKGGIKTVSLDAAARSQALSQARTIQQVTTQRQSVEHAAPSAPLTQPRQAKLSVPTPQAVGPRASSVKLLTPPTGASTTHAQPAAGAAAHPATAGAPQKPNSTAQQHPLPPNGRPGMPTAPAGKQGGPYPGRPGYPPPRQQPGHPAPAHQPPPEKKAEPPSRSNG